ncbi:GNAT family N-acetyltransferase [Shewanella avicenniae]|uniref:GNAT family N-acetyltransferase n=1 Tax=Shewanella avicenniae TaxID=2814294 RepID=A0ABX7QRT4_9GAMM|nr:GNAT family N-acetyltransferase [Shewanella avicenniae]QSX34157.1 GNAT family N-acetyltransferase [Shewanella avicenniae]
MQITIDPLTSADIIGLLQQHLDDMYATSPAESVHALDLDKLRQPEITFWSARKDDELLGCLALKVLDGDHAELKSMRTAPAARGKGVASALLQHALLHARAQGLRQVSLETGTMAYFAAARSLYRKFGFSDCPPFADYQLDPNSAFMTLHL